LKSIDSIWFSKRKIIYFFAVLLSFFIFISVNLVLHFVSYFVVLQKIIFDWRIVYGHYCIPISNNFQPLPFYCAVVFLIIKLCIVCINLIYLKKISSYVAVFTGIFIMMDLMRVVLESLPLPIDWGLYFHSSSLDLLSTIFGYPTWVWFGLSGLGYLSIFQYFTKTNKIEIFKYFSIAIASFFFQLLVTYFLLGKIYTI
jgi:hypothetical protein